MLLEPSNTNRRAKVCKCVGFESPLTPTLSPLIKGGEGRSGGILHAQQFVNFVRAIGIRLVSLIEKMFQWAPTLGGECYFSVAKMRSSPVRKRFQWAPTLGGECYVKLSCDELRKELMCFNGHPPLGVNATRGLELPQRSINTHVSMGTHPWG